MTDLDERVAAGMRAQLADRDERVRAGARQIGWKVGFGAPAAMSALRLDRPLVGFLLDAGVLPDGAAVPVGGWARPMLEPEIAVHLANDVPGGATVADVRAAVGGLSAAIELADVDPPPQDVRTILAGNIFQRHVVLGPTHPERRSAAGVSARLLVDGTETAATDDPAALTGDLLVVVQRTAELLASCGERLRAGAVVITGSVLPPIPVAPGLHVEVRLDPLGALSLSFV
jgi:2-keto-4-pentenoate hydratase